ncbi:MAG: twin-arginine translocation signal domain-containing protein, partial [Chloroflexi bacterium]|nr:twin-arginine translocation signal domain-containing protein [Chloroflexota bacterium]
MSIENPQSSDQKKRLSRRDFLRLSSSVVGMAALAGCVAPTAAPAAPAAA